MITVHVSDENTLDLAGNEDGVDELALCALPAVKKHLPGSNPYTNARTAAADRGHLGRRAQDLNIKACQELGVLHDDSSSCHVGGVEGRGGGRGGGRGKEIEASPKATDSPSRHHLAPHGVHYSHQVAPVGCSHGRL